MYLGIDYGTKRIGLAVGNKFPRGIGVLDGDRELDLIAEDIATICREEEVEKIIIGLPERSQGEPGTINKEIKRFAEKVKEKSGLEIAFEPEAFTSTEASEYLKEYAKKRGEKGKVDELSAILILEQYIKRIENKL